MNKSYIFYMILGSMGIATVGGFFNLSFLIYIGTASMVIGSLFIPKLDEANRPQKVLTEKVIDAEVINNKQINQKF